MKNPLRTNGMAFRVLGALVLVVGGPATGPAAAQIQGSPAGAREHRAAASRGTPLTTRIQPAAARPKANEVPFRAAVSAEELSGLRARTIGPAVMSGRVVDLAVVESDPQVFYVASATGGLWKTTNNGVTFTPVFEREAVHSIGDVAVHPVDTSVVWVGTGERANRQSSSWGNGVYRSTDGGRTWVHVGLEQTHHIGRIALHPTDPRIAYVAAMGHLWGPNPERGLYLTRDGGGSWEQILYVDEDTGVVDVALDPSQPEIVYAATYQRRRRPYGFHGGGPGSALWKSEDGGRSWRRLTAPGLNNGLPEGELGRIGISIFRADPRIVYVSIEQGLRYNASTAYEERRAGIYRSEDRGESWSWMSDWNPRPMYASQILVDPSDDQRIYMENSFSWSDDGGRTFTSPRQSLHGDDRFLWVDPSDSRHLVKADDGGVGISYDRGRTWLYLTHLPVSQFYRITFDFQNPYWVYGGLQDNGSWAGPNATYRTEGVLNEDWVKWGGGDGFLSLVDSAGGGVLYVESQYLGLSRVELASGMRQWIRPGDPRGAIAARRNWRTWPYPDLGEERLGNAMAPANWDGPFLLSPHDARTIYAGTDRLWRSRDQGRSWEDLGRMTTGVDRRDLRIMGRLPGPETLSLDDGIPYYPTVTAIAESPLEEGVLYVGTDDGNVQVSRDGGATWTEVSQEVPGLPEDAWISGLEASRFQQGRLYLAANNYRNDDYRNFLFVSEDYGASWTPIADGLPPERVARTVREDPRNPDLLYLGTEFGAFASFDRGASWTALSLGMPTVAVNDLVVHPRDNDLILATHGRGIWILDQVNALQELTPSVASSRLHLFTMEPAEEIRYRSEKGHSGDMIFRGENPPAGALIDYWLAEPADSVLFTVRDEEGREVARQVLSGRRGVNRAVWDLHFADLGAGAAEDQQGPWVNPRSYTVRLSVDGEQDEGRLEVREDPRIRVPSEIRRQWTADLLALRDLAQRAATGAAPARALADRVAMDPVLSEAVGDAVAELLRQWEEVRARIRRLRNEVEEWVGPLTAQQESQRTYYEQMVAALTGETESLADRIRRDPRQWRQP